MDDANNSDIPNSPDGPSIPGSMVRLRERLATVARIVYRAANEPVAGAVTASILDKYREPVSSALRGLGDAIADFLDETQGLATADLERELQPLVELSRGSPLFRWSFDALTQGEDHYEVQRLLHDQPQAGFDLPSLLLQDFYDRSVLASTYRSRVAAVAQILLDEVCARANRGQDVVRVLALGAGSASEIEPVLAERRCARVLHLTLVDEHAATLRRVRERFAHRLPSGLTVVRANPRGPGNSLRRWQAIFDIVEAIDLFDLCPRNLHRTVIGDAHGALKPGGVFLTGSYLPSVPRSSQALTVALLGTSLNYSDEREWRSLMQSVPLEPGSLTFRRVGEAGIVLTTRRSPST